MTSSAQGTLLRGWFVDAQVMLVYNPVIAVKIGDSSLVVKLSWQTKRRSISGGLWAPSVGLTFMSGGHSHQTLSY